MAADADESPGAVYDWWSRHPRALSALYDLAFLERERTFRRRALDRLNLSPGECALEVGCGNGNSFTALRDGIGDEAVSLDSTRNRFSGRRYASSIRFWCRCSK